ncbi:conserved protein of unknown function [Nitratireductor aquimarinus]|uniref:hypothetical protein n=1 Tax=Nitratireductor aquimarinus TaxID=889300 RepID=UPI003B5CA650
MRLFIGYKPGVGGVVKVMKNNGDDPLTTPNTDYSKFLFNSETGKIGYIKGFDVEQFNWSYNDQYANFYLPSGTGPESCDKAYAAYGSLQHIYLFPRRKFGRSYPLVTETRLQVPLGARNAGPRVSWVIDDTAPNGAKVGRNVGYPTYEMKNTREIGIVDSPGYMDRITLAEAAEMRTGRNSASRKFTFITYDLPADEAPIPTGTPAGSGSRSVLINPTTVKVAKGSASVDSGNPDDLIMDSDIVPLKIAKAGREVLAAGQYVDVFPSGPALTTETYVDYMVWPTGGVTAVPQHIPQISLTDQNYNFEYEIHANKVRLVNNGDRSLTVTYVITRDDGAKTTGGGKVMETLPDGHVRIKRPGSSDTTPADADVLLDTRLAYMPIIADGYLAASDFNEAASGIAYGDRAKTITFSNDGFIPFLKYYVKRRDRNGNFYAWTSPKTMVLRSGVYDPDGWAGRQASDGTVAVLSNNSVKFHMALGHPHRLEVSTGGGLYTASPVFSNYDKPMGIRYFVFAIPTNL